MSSKARRVRNEEITYLFVGTVRGIFVYESNYLREVWRRTGPFLEGCQIGDIVFDYRDEESIYACGDGQAAAVTRDYGRTWQDLGRIEGSCCRSLALGKHDEQGTLFAGYDANGIAHTQDGGANWSHLDGLRSQLKPDADSHVHSVVLEEGSAQRLFVVTSAANVLRSDDGGVSWSEIGEALNLGRSGPPVVHRLLANPARPDVLYASTSDGIFRTADAGQSWDSVAGELSEGVLSPAIAVSSARPATIYAAPDRGALALYRSRDAGDEWEHLTELSVKEPTSVRPRALSLDDLPEEGVYIGTENGEVHLSSDEGDSWDFVAGGLPPITTMTPVVLLAD